jgi:hypothetical protein
MYPRSDTEVDVIEQTATAQLEALGYTASNARKIFCTFDLMMTAPERQRLAILRRLNHFVR